MCAQRTPSAPRLCSHSTPPIATLLGDSEKLSSSPGGSHAPFASKVSVRPATA